MKHRYRYRYEIRSSKYHILTVERRKKNVCNWHKNKNNNPLSKAIYNVISPISSLPKGKFIFLYSFLIITGRQVWRRRNDNWDLLLWYSITTGFQGDDEVREKKKVSKARLFRFFLFLSPQPENIKSLLHSSQKSNQVNRTREVKICLSNFIGHVWKVV